MFIVVNFISVFNLSGKSCLQPLNHREAPKICEALSPPLQDIFSFQFSSTHGRDLCYLFLGVLDVSSKSWQHEPAGIPCLGLALFDRRCRSCVLCVLPCSRPVFSLPGWALHAAAWSISGWRRICARIIAACLSLLHSIFDE